MSSTNAVFFGAEPNSAEVVFAQPGEDEVKPATTQARFLLSMRDQVCVPPGNAFTIENHSAADVCVLVGAIDNLVVVKEEGGATSNPLEDQADAQQQEVSSNVLHQQPESQGCRDQNDDPPQEHKVF